MPLYLFKCNLCNQEKEYIKSFDTKQFPHENCEGTMEKQMSFKFNGLGLPNGFSSTRTGTKEQRGFDVNKL